LASTLSKRSMTDFSGPKNRETRTTRRNIRCCNTPLDASPQVRPFLG
jgi:hypothetical protein